MKFREKFCAWLFEISKAPYRAIFKRSKQAWNLESVDLLAYEPNTLGYAVGQFLQNNQFELIDKLESHDVYHVICEMNTSVRDEIGMQYLLMGNGKKSVYQKLTVLLGICLLPEYRNYYRYCYKRGQKMNPVYLFDLKKELNSDLHQLRTTLQAKPFSSSLRIWNINY
jgi:ubiquinone biosynthesis protein Coq4